MSGDIRTLEDGTRIYSNGTRYTPVSEHLRKYKRRTTETGPVIEPLELLSEEERVMPESLSLCNRRDTP